MIITQNTYKKYKLYRYTYVSESDDIFSFFRWLPRTNDFIVRLVVSVRHTCVSLSNYTEQNSTWKNDSPLIFNLNGDNTLIDISKWPSNCPDTETDKCVFYITNEMQLIQCSLLLSALYKFRAIFPPIIRSL